MIRVLRLAVLACAAVFAAAISAAPAGVNATASGDADCDGGVDAADALAVLRDAAGLSSAACIGVADVDCDEDVDTIDALSIMRHVAGLTVNFPDGCPPIGTEAGILLLNEAFFLPGPGDAAFVELKNAGGGPASLGGVTLVNEASETYAVPGGTLVAGALLLVEPGGAFLDPESGFVELRRGGDVLDRVAWGEGQPGGVNMTHGGVSLGLEPGTAIARQPASIAPGTADWTPAAAGAATPGAPNPAPGMGPMLPLDGALIDGGVALRWYAVPGADSYRVQVSADDTFAASLVDQTVAVPALDPGTLGQGEYHWRVEPLVAGGSAGFSAAQSFTVIAAATVADAAPEITAHKDTGMLLLESPNETGDHAWDRDHEQFDGDDPADSMNAVPAAVAAVNALLGGSLSQDRISYEVMKGRMIGAERDLGWNDAYSREQGLAAMLFALGGATEFCSTNKAEVLVGLLDALNGGSPVVALAGEHPVAVSGYRTEAHPPDPVKTFVTVHDPFIGVYEADFEKAGFSCLWRPPENAFPGFDEPEISADTDGDGIVDFDEMFRFGTSPALTDTDQDGRGDKEDVAESVFHHEFGYAGDVAFMGPSPFPSSRPRDWDRDGVNPELDCDSDNDGSQDGDDGDNFSTPSQGQQPATCGSGDAVVTLAWNADADLDLFVLPNAASSEDEAFPQFNLSGFHSDSDPECRDKGPDETQRTAQVDGVGAPSSYVGVWMFTNCGRDPAGPEGDGPTVVTLSVTVQLPGGGVHQYSDTLTHETDDWRLYGPFDFSDCPAPSAQPGAARAPADCASATKVTLSWPTDTNLALWLLPNPASNEAEAIAQNALPGYRDRRGGWCNYPSEPEDVPRDAIIGDFEPVGPESRYIAVEFVDFCRRPPTGPEGDGPQSTAFTITVEYVEGPARQIAGVINYGDDNWRLYNLLQ